MKPKQNLQKQNEIKSSKMKSKLIDILNVTILFKIYCMNTNIKVFILEINKSVLIHKER